MQSPRLSDKIAITDCDRIRIITNRLCFTEHFTIIRNIFNSRTNHALDLFTHFRNLLLISSKFIEHFIKTFCFHAFISLSY